MFKVLVTFIFVAITLMVTLAAVGQANSLMTAGSAERPALVAQVLAGQEAARGGWLTAYPLAGASWLFGHDFFPLGDLSPEGGRVILTFEVLKSYLGGKPFFLLAAWPVILTYLIYSSFLGRKK